jgi:hypothetical protein
MVVKAVAAGSFVPSDGAIVEDGDTVTVEAGAASANGTLGVTGGSLDEVTLATNAAILIDQQASVNINQYDGSGSFAATVGVSNNVPSFQLANATTRIVVDALSVDVKLQSGTGLSASSRINIAAGVLTGVTLPTFYSLVNNGLAIVVPVTGTYVDRITPQVNSAGAITGFTLS